jgi:hypothetical protein
MVTKELDSTAVLSQFYQRLVVLEKELARLSNAQPAAQGNNGTLTFAGLRGVWAGLDLSYDDIARSRIKAPELSTSWTHMRSFGT